MKKYEMTVKIEDSKGTSVKKVRINENEIDRNQAYARTLGETGCTRSVTFRKI